jgi:hypothetical protein
MDKYRELKVDGELIRYLEEYLANGKTLSGLLLDSIDFASGKVVTTLPVSVSEEAARDFRSGGKLAAESSNLIASRLQPMPDTDSRLAEMAREFLAGGEGRLCIFEDASAGVDDPYLQSVETRTGNYGNEVYHLLLRADAQEAKILSTIKEARSWMLAGAFTSAPPDDKYQSKVVALITEELRAFAEQTEKIVVGAYDGEGYLIWSKS